MQQHSFSYNEQLPKQTQIMKLQQRARKPLISGWQLYWVYSLLTHNTSLCVSLGKTWLGQPHCATCAVILSNLAESWSQRCCHGRNHTKNRLCSGVMPDSDSAGEEPYSVWFTLIRLRLYNQHWLLPFTSQLNTPCILIAISSLLKLKQLGVVEQRITWCVVCVHVCMNLGDATHTRLLGLCI